MDGTGTNHDVVIVGGGAAGLSAGLMLSRARRAVLVIDDGAPRNAPATASSSAGVHNYLGREGTPPAELLTAGRAEVAGYGGILREGRAVAARPDGTAGSGFEVDLADGTMVRARRLLVTAGAVDEVPAVPGVPEHWGGAVLHCPYCHGWEVRDREVAVLATSAASLHQAQMLRQWTSHVTLVLHGVPAPDAAQHGELSARGIAVVPGPATALEDGGDGRYVLRLEGGRRLDVDALAVTPRTVARSAVLESLGLAPVEQVVGGHVLGEAVPAEPSGATAVPGVYVAGNVSDLRATVSVAAAAGTLVAAAINADLVADDVRLAVAAHDARTEHAQQGPQDRHGHRDHGDGHGRPEDEVTDGAAFWEDFYRDREQVWTGRANPVLVEVAESLPVGRALDVGAGEGGDALWLAARGWDVTAIDIADSALERVGVRAKAEGLDVATARVDLAVEEPAGCFDLVSAQYLHSPVTGFPRERVLGAAAGAVAAGGLLLVVGHGRLAPWSWDPTLVMPTAGEVLATLELDPERWTVERVESRERKATGPDGQIAVVTDEIVAARRRS